MANFYRAKDGQRLDSIIQQHYGSLTHFEAVLEVNAHLLGKSVLDAGDIVNLPIFNEQVEVKKSDSTWTLWGRS